jgi:hypothetical protein
MDKNSIYKLYFLNKQEQQKALKIFETRTGKRSVENEVDNQVLTDIFRGLAETKIKKSTPKQLMKYLDYLNKKN